MPAMSVFQSLLIDQTKASLTLATGAICQGDGGGGGYSGGRLTSSSILPNVWHDLALDKTIDLVDRAGAGILTILKVSLACAGTGWIVSEE